MQEDWKLRVIARIESDFSTKFGIPRQSGLVPSLRAKLVFEPPFRDENALRGLEGYSHIWILWGFSAVEMDKGFHPMVKPPRLGGGTRKGVFATRSPFRPNPIGLSCVELLSMEKEPGRGTVLHIGGADMMHGSPVYDIKPYLPFTESHPEARAGFAGERRDYALELDFPEAWLAMIPKDKREALCASLRQDPRPSYLARTEPDARFGFEYAGYDVRFVVEGDVLHVVEVVKL